MLRAHLDNLKQNDFIPDLIIIDYDDYLKADSIAADLLEIFREKYWEIFRSSHPLCTLRDSSEVPKECLWQNPFGRTGNLLIKSNTSLFLVHPAGLEPATC